MTNHSLIPETWLWIEISAPVSGINAAGVLDKSQSLGNTGGEHAHLLDNGIDVPLDGNPYSMHHKVISIDDQIMITSSYNFSNCAKTPNDENTLVVDSPETAVFYMEKFERVWLTAQEKSR